MEVKILQKEDKKTWDEFVNQHSEGRFVHLSSYKDILEKSYGYKGRFFYIQEQEEISSVFPFFEFKSFFKKRFISQPFDAYGGILIKETLPQKQKIKVIQTWINYLKNWLSKDKFLEIHGQIDEISLMRKYFGGTQLKHTAILKLNSYQEVFQKFDYQIKKAIQKAKREGVIVYSETNPAAIKNKFYPLYTHFFNKRHGSPPHSLNFFLNCYQSAPQNVKIYFAEINQKLVAALWGFLIGDRIQIYCNPCLEKYFPQRPNDFLHSEFIKWACQNNFKYCDFGPARYKGQIIYKKKWGGEFLDYFYFYLSSQPKKFKVLVPENLYIKFFSWIWRNILPEKLANKLGPFIRKVIGK